MKQKLIFILVLFMIPFSVLTAATPLADYPSEELLNVSVDFRNLQGTCKIAFAKSALSTDNPFVEVGSDSFISGNETNAFILSHDSTIETDVIAKAEGYVCWRLYSDLSLNIFLSIGGALESNGQTPINWTVDVGGNKIGSDKNVYAKPEILIYGYNPTSKGIGGSEKIVITTDSLIDIKTGVDYAANLYAKVITVV